MFDVQKFIKDVGDVITEKLSKAHDRMEKIEISIKDFTPYDDQSVLELMSKQEEVIKSLQDEVEHLKGIEIPAAYDDTELKKSLEDHIKEFESLEIPAPFDDTKLKESLEINSKAWGEMNKTLEDHIKAFESLEIPAAYDDEELVKAYEELDDNLLRFKKQLMEFENKEYPSIMPKAVNYNIEPLDAGTFVKYKNSLWLNLMKDNDTPPAVDNHSYQLIIEAPKEIEHKGVYEEGKNYKHGDIVMFNDNTWFKTSDPAQTIPSEGWKLFAKRGKQGRKGEATIIENDTTEAMQEMYDEILQLKGEIKRLKDASKN